ncbi:MAG: hypothetical protein ACKVJE_09155 [Pseudomonadales bacterium]
MKFGMILKYVALFQVLLLLGCNVDTGIISDMDSLYEEKEGESDVTNAITRHIDKSTDLDGFLTMLHRTGFKIIEYQREGARSWPDGALRPYDNDVKRSIQNRIEETEKKYVARIIYDKRIFTSKEAVISITKGPLSFKKVEAHIYITGL